TTPADTQPGVSATPSASTSPPVDLDTTSVLLGLDAETGARRWELPLPALSRTGAAVVGTQAFVGTDEGDVVAVDVATGDERWRAEAGDEVRLPLAATSDLVLVPTTPSEASGSSDLVALGGADGDEAWRFTPPIAGSIVGSPAAGTAAAFVALSDQTVVSLDLATGKVAWSASTGYPGGFTPAVFEDQVVAIDGRGQVYALDIADGERRWDFALNLNIFGPPVAGPPIGSDRYLLVPGDAGTIAVLDVGAGEMVFELTVSDGVVLGVAANSDGVVASTTGGSPGLVGVRHDAAGTLTSIPSPTVPDLPLLLGAWALAAVPAAVISWLLGKALWNRLGPLELPDGTDDLDEDDVDAEAEA
ncbi:MAG: outer membrane protein assembly factor BamB family protein, partial [Actinomycetota bacterium]